MPTLVFRGREIELRAGESVLEALRRHGVDVLYSCGKGTCQTCVLRCLEGPLPSHSQRGLKDTLKAQGYFLACLCRPEGSLCIDDPSRAELYEPTRVARKELLSESVCRLWLEPPRGFAYHAGQFVNLRREDGLVRSYSLASLPVPGAHLELHVRKKQNGKLSTYLFDELREGTALELYGPHGACFYLPDRPEQPLLLIGTGTGLAPLLGIVREARWRGHRGPIWLYHGASTRTGLYCQDELARLARDCPLLSYVACVSREPGGGQVVQGRASEIALARHPDLTNMRVFLCGSPPMVHATKRRAFMQGAAIADIHADAFELTDLRRSSDRTGDGR